MSKRAVLKRGRAFALPLFGSEIRDPLWASVTDHYTRSYMAPVVYKRKIVKPS